MADETAAFVKDPWDYIQKKLVNNSRPAQAIWCDLEMNDAKKNVAAIEIIRCIDGNELAPHLAQFDQTYDFQLVTSQHAGVTNSLLRPDVDTLLETHKKLSPRMNKLYSNYVAQRPMHWTLRSLWPSSVKAYYFPYKTGGVTQADDMGYVDFPKVDPPHRFAFTGGMNGCNLVVTDSPLEGHLRAWHYQSATSNPIYLPKMLGRGRFPGFVFDWLYHEEYEHLGGRVYDPPQNRYTNTEVNAFNFLYYHEDDRSWWLYSQPQKIVQDHQSAKPATYVDWSRTKPFRRRIQVAQLERRNSLRLPNAPLAGNPLRRRGSF